MKALFRQIVCVLSMCAAVLVAGGGVASAHSASNAPSSNYVSTINSITPKPTTWKARIIEAGSRLEVKWLEGPELTMPDYDGNPYLRIGPDGVFENTQSAAVYINKDRQGSNASTPIPDNLDPSGPPTWRKITGDSTARIHWHPIHYMGSTPPPQVQRNPNKVQLVQTYDPPVVIRQGSTRYSISGDVRWVPGPSKFPPLAVGALAGLLIVGATIMLGRRGSHEDGERWRASRPMQRALTIYSVAMLALILVDVLHLSGIAFGVQGGSGVGRMLGIGWVSFVAWAMGLGAIAGLRRGKFDGLYLCVFAAGIMTLVGGLSDLSVLSASSVPFAYSLWVARFSIALTLGLGIALIVAGVVLTGIRPPLAGDDAPTE